MIGLSIVPYEYSPYLMYFVACLCDSARQVPGNRYLPNISRSLVFGIFPVAPTGMASANARSSGTCHQPRCVE
jgi:hypothetical protein